MRFLAIDDTKSVHAFINDIFSSTSHEVVSVYSGQEGIDLIKKSPNFDAILLDWEMPGLDGCETLEQLKLMDCKIPVIMVTSRNHIKDVSKALSLGAAEYIMKPFTKSIVMEKLEFILNTKVG